MKTLSLTEAKTKLSGLVEKVRARDAAIMIAKNGRPVAMLVSPDEFNSWKETKETVAIRADDALMREIKAGLSALKAKKAKLYTLKELFK